MQKGKRRRHHCSAACSYLSGRRVVSDALDSLGEETLDYTLASISTLPVVTRKEGKQVVVQSYVCKYWEAVGMMKCLDGTADVKYLSKLAKCLLALPHSSADSESIVCKIVTDSRTVMDKSTLRALLSYTYTCL